MESGSLAFESTAGMETWATVGYIPNGPDSSTGSGQWEDRYELQLDQDPGSDGGWRKLEATHKLGHVFGFVHEHPRHDRDSYFSGERQQASGTSVVRKKHSIKADG
jgi:hypothetical protein